ncbi:amidohydrolase [Roseomonas populi]|uniref:Amidohydrolase n=1 Tax=Roseomonas populi TaxID=3121582 RepID=A0ABT1X6J8_9PROT|nr:amidohydrolase [Roseomonas pecuniae]MCR0982787.1 amidohydrolase [Roseomonas pecuniae]
MFRRPFSKSLVADAPLARRGFLAAACACCVLPLGARAQTRDGVAAGPARPFHAALDEAARVIEPRMIGWRRDIHQNPELGNQEVRTSGLVAAHLRGLGYSVREKVAVTGIVATLRGEGGPGPVVALRADMDALPVAEEVDLPFASRARTNWGGQDVGVMHACGHDCHTAILMAAAEVLAKHRADLKGTVVLIFQPAEEGLPGREIGGARRMLEEGAFETTRPEVVFGLHVTSGLSAGQLGYRPGPANASADEFTITVRGRQTHGARPWAGVDPIVIAAQIVTALQTIQSRQVDVNSPSVLTVGQIHGGNRNNIIPDSVMLNGTLRTYDEERRRFIMRRTKEVAESVAAGMDGRAEVDWSPTGYPSNANDPALTARMAPSLARVVAAGELRLMPPGMAAEDFSYFSRSVPGLFFNVGVTAPGLDPREVPTNHSPRFRVDKSGLLPGLRAMLHLVADYTSSGAA